jgi:hypothetical protein
MQAGAEVEEGAERYEACSRAKKYSAKYTKDRLVANKLVCSRNGGQEASGWRKDKGQGRGGHKGQGTEELRWRRGSGLRCHNRREFEEKKCKGFFFSRGQ